MGLLHMAIKRFLRWLSSKKKKKKKNLPVNARDEGDVGSIPELGLSLLGGNGSPFQYSGLENPKDRGVWWAAVHRVTKNQT